MRKRSQNHCLKIDVSSQAEQTRRTPIFHLKSSLSPQILHPSPELQRWHRCAGNDNDCVRMSDTLPTKLWYPKQSLSLHLVFQWSGERSTTIENRREINYGPSQRHGGGEHQCVLTWQCFVVVHKAWGKLRCLRYLISPLSAFLGRGWCIIDPPYRLSRPLGRCLAPGGVQRQAWLRVRYRQDPPYQ